MRKAKKTGFILAICMLLTATIYLLSSTSAQASEIIRPDEFFFVFNGQNKKSGTEYEMKNESVLLQVKAEGWSPEYQVQWVTSEPGVVALEPNENNSFVNMVRKGPGYSTITAIVKIGTNTYSLSCLVKVNLEFDHYRTGTTTATTTKDRILVINEIDGLEKQIYLKYVNYIPDEETKEVTGSAISVSSVTWESDNESVVTVDDKGKVKAIGSGSANIIVTTNTMSSQDRSLSISIPVVVAPKFTLNFNDIHNNHRTVHSVNNINNYTPVDDVPSNFIIESNATYGVNLTWEVIDSSTKNKVTNNKMTYTVNENSGSVTFSNVKAGTYEIFAYANENYNYKTNAPYAYMKIIVPIYIANQNIVMNVGDTFSIVENSNLPSFNIFEFDYGEYGAGGINTAHVDGRTGLITARKKGEVTIYLRYKSSSNLYDGSIVVDPITIKVTIIDGISLSATEAMLYTSGTLLLQAYVTDTDEPVIWSSNLPNIVKVENGLVTALRPGEAIITATQKIKEGVIKRATCKITVQQSVSSITLDPPVLNLAIDEYKTIYANITPKLSGVKLNWKTSDEKVVKIMEANPLTLTVQGVAGGNAVISAINEDNIVVGYSHVTVRQPVSRISLSDTNVYINIDAKSIQLRAIVYPENSLNKEIIWTSSNPQIARVNENGLVTLVKPGEVAIIARSADNPEVMELCNITIEVPVATVALDESEVTMYVGQTQRLNYSILPINASKTAVTWTSTKPNVATVDAAGRVTAKQVGSTVIMLKTLDGGHTAYSTIIVRQIAEGIKFTNTEIEMFTGQVHELDYSLIPVNATDSNIVWEASDTRVAVVDDVGKITAKGPGTAFVIARTEAGGMSYVKVTVKEPVSGLLLNFSEKTIYVRESFDLKASVSPSGASNLGVDWKSSNDKVATVSDSGEVIGVSAGMAIITVTTKDGGIEANCVVTVRERITSMTLDPASYRVGLNKSFTLSVIIENETATDQQFRWSSSNSDIASVNKKGKVTGHKLGNATITAHALDGSGAQASSDVEVVRAATRITLDKSSLSMLVGETKKLNAKIEPSNASYKKPMWVVTSVDDPDVEVKGIVLVDDDGNITALKEGSVMVYAITQDSSEKVAACHVSVFKRVPATSVILSDKKLVMIQGEQREVRPVLNPIGSTDGLTWSSDNNSVASVNKSTGRIKANATGTAYITAMTDSGKTATTEVTVIGLNVTKLELEQYSEYTLVVEGATSRVTWDVANPDIAVIRNGRVSTRARGTTTITATVNGRKLTCKLTVTKIK